MNTKKIICGIAIATMGFSTLAVAQPTAARQEARQDLREGRRDINEAQRDIRKAEQDLARARTPQQRAEAQRDLREAQRDLQEARQDTRQARRYLNARGPEFRRGARLPQELRARHYVVQDYRGHRLSAPPRGYQWVQVGPDYVLAAIATGIITNLVIHR